MEARSANVHQLLNATFYLFGLVFFLTLPEAAFINEVSGTPTATLILQNFLRDFAFASNVFFVLLVLHLVRWFVSGRLRASASLLNAHAAD